MKDDARLVVRADLRQFTLETTFCALCGLWPAHRLLGKVSAEDKPTQTALFGDKTVKPGEVDILVLPKRDPIPEGFWI